MNFAPSRPPAVAIPKESAPRPKIKSESGLRNVWAWALAPTEKPSRIVTMSIIALRAEFASRSVTPDSLRMFPKKSMPSRAIDPGAIRAAIRNAAIGKMILSRREITRGSGIRIRRSSLVGSSFMIGGWITGTRAM